MNTNQNSRHTCKAEDIDWNGIKAIGITKEELEKNGNLNRLLQGEESEVIPLKINTGLINLSMDATLKLVSGKDGRRVMEINGIRPEETTEE